MHRLKNPSPVPLIRSGRELMTSVMIGVYKMENPPLNRQDMITSTAIFFSIKKLPSTSHRIMLTSPITMVFVTQAFFVILLPMIPIAMLTA